MTAYFNSFEEDTNYSQEQSIPSDFGPNPFIVDLKKATMQNDNFRTTLWTGDHLQLVLMNIPVKEVFGMDFNPNADQIIRVEEGQGLVQLGSDKFSMYSQYLVFEDHAIFIPAGTWHNIVNIGNTPLKLYSIYSPPNYPWNTVQQTRTMNNMPFGNAPS